MQIRSFHIDGSMPSCFSSETFELAVPGRRLIPGRCRRVTVESLACGRVVLVVSERYKHMALIFLPGSAEASCSAQRRTGAEHGECSLMLRGNGLQRSGGGDRKSSNAVNRVTNPERGRRIMAAGGSLVHPFSLFNCLRRVASKLDRVAE